MIQTFEVANVRCGGCANTITKALQEAGFKEVSVDLSCEPRKVSADIQDESSAEKFTEILKERGYPLITDENRLKDKAMSFISCAIGKIN